MGRRLTAATLRAKNEWEVDIGDGVMVLCRRVDLLQAYLTGAIPTPLLAALSRLVKNGKGITQAPDPTQALLSISPEDRAGSLELMKRWVCMSAVDPIIELDKPADPAKVWIDDLTTAQIIAIFSATVEHEGGKNGEVITPGVSAAQAERFPVAGPAPADSPAIPDVEEVSPTTVHVSDSDILELKHS